MLAQTPVDSRARAAFRPATRGADPGGSSSARSCWARCGMRELVIGHDHGFGRGRSGDVDTLRRLGAELDFAVDVVPPVDVGDQHVSSSRIRRALAGGDLATAAAAPGPALPGKRDRGPRRAAWPAAGRADDQSRRRLTPQAAASGRGVCGVGGDAGRTVRRHDEPGRQADLPATAGAPWKRTCSASTATSTASRCASNGWSGSAMCGSSLPSKHCRRSSRATARAPRRSSPPGLPDPSGAHAPRA